LAAGLADDSQRILSARDNIDQHIANSRGGKFVDRMLLELPSISRVDASGDDKLQAAETEEATILICERCIGSKG
jgi:hypothetical protein